MRLAAVWYPVARWDESRRFYEGVLGLKLNHVSDEAGYAAYGSEQGVPFFLVRKPERAGGQGGAVVDLSVPDVEALRQRLLAGGYRVEAYTQEGPSVRTITFYDPDGNMLEASQAT